MEPAQHTLLSAERGRENTGQRKRLFFLVVIKKGAPTTCSSSIETNSIVGAKRRLGKKGWDPVRQPGEGAVALGVGPREKTKYTLLHAGSNRRFRRDKSSPDDF